MITIIGGSGFRGSRLCSQLRTEGVDFIIIDKKSFSFFHGTGKNCGYLR